MYASFNREKSVLVGKLIIKLAPTGMIPTKHDTSLVPLSPEEIENDVRKCYNAGVSMVHIHARDDDGRPTHEKKYFKEIFKRIYRSCPNIIICATTSGRVVPQVEHRSEVLDLHPEMASLTLGSLNFPQHPSVNSFETIKALANKMKEKEIFPELEIFESGFINTAKYLARKGYLKKPLHFNILLGSLGSMPADLRDLTYVVDSLPKNSTWSATGIGRFQTQINVAAILMGGHVRVGIEDSIYYNYPSKRLASNLELVERIIRISEDLGREIASPKEAREIIGIKK